MSDTSQIALSSTRDSDMVTSLHDPIERREAVSPPGDLDWFVVEAARTGSLFSLNPDNLVARLARGLFGVSLTNSLADKKLEALRRLSVRAWHWDFIRNKDIRAFIEAGYSRIDLLEILSHIGLARGLTPSIEYEFATIPVRKSSHPCRCG
jgi:hypothetical protein